MIGQNIFRGVAESTVCVADMTGLNPNVLYEMGVRHALREPIVHIAELGTPLPFDNAPHLTHFYELQNFHSLDQLRADLSDEIGRVIAGGYDVSNPFTQALGAIELRRSGDPKDRIIAQLEERMERLERNLRKRGGAFAPTDSARAAMNSLRSMLRELLADDNTGTTYDIDKFAADLTNAGNLFSAENAETLLDLLHQKGSYRNAQDLIEILNAYNPELGSAHEHRASPHVFPNALTGFYNR